MLALAVVLILGCTLGLCTAILLVGHYATVPARLNHEVTMLKLGEDMKLNAINLRERDLNLAERHMKMLSQSYSLEHAHENHRLR